MILSHTKVIKQIDVICRIGILCIAFFCIKEVRGEERIKWLETEYDFGVFHEEAGRQKGYARFVNIGKRATIINKVKPSCGCTDARYTEGEIAPGDTATVEFEYNPVGRPGSFAKTVKVYTGEDNEMHIIKIHGTVIGTPQTLERDYPLSTGALRISDTIVNVGDVKYGTTRHTFLKVYNQSEHTLYPEVKSNNQALEVKMSGDGIAPGEVGTISLYLNTRNTFPGKFNAKVSITDKGDPAEVEYRANIESDAYGLTAEQLALLPVCEIKERAINVGEMKDKDKDKGITFEIKNSGKTPLHIQEVTSDTEAIKFKSWPREIKPGKRGKVTGELTPGGIPEEGAFRRIIEIKSDDLVHPKVIISVVGIRK